MMRGHFFIEARSNFPCSYLYEPTGASTNAMRTIPLKRTRFWLICLFFLVWGTVIGGRLFWLQVVRHKDFLRTRREAAAAYV